MTKEQIEMFYLNKIGDNADYVRRNVSYINRKIHRCYFNNITKYATGSHSMKLKTDDIIFVSILVLCIL